MPTKYIFVTGGVVSSIGKGICVASIGRILKSQGLSVTVAKLDPYLNVDPGTMSPYQHGEVFVTKDGGETDLDLGHYERFIDVELTRDSNVTAGQAYLELITRERRGDFLGGTIQTVPHLTNEIKDRLISLAEKSEADVVIVEVGGTVGDIEGLPFLEAIRQMRNTVGRNNVFYMHLTLLPYISASEELKTKPTQHSVKELRGIGIQPDALICRSDTEITRSIQEKLSLFCDVETEAVFPMPTVGNVYEVPLIMEEFGLGSFLSQSLNLDGKLELREWYDLVNRMNAAERAVPIAIVGKYVEYPDSYMSVREALRHAAASCGLRAEGPLGPLGSRGTGWTGRVPEGRLRNRGSRRIRATRRGGYGGNQPVCQGQRGSLPGPLPGYAGDGDRLGPRRGRAALCQFIGVGPGL